MTVTGHRKQQIACTEDRTNSFFFSVYWIFVQPTTDILTGISQVLYKLLSRGGNASVESEGPA